jgi:hypothetical protein
MELKMLGGLAAKVNGRRCTCVTYLQEILVAPRPEKRQYESFIADEWLSQMALFDSTRVIGWLSVFLLGILIALPYLPTIGAGAKARSSLGFFRLPLRRMTFHYWLAPLVALGSFVHAWIPMASRHMPRTNYSGLWLASLALGLILMQLGLGVVLRFTRRGTPSLLRRTHFALMLGIAALVLLHLWMNSPLIHGGD